MAPGLLTCTLKLDAEPLSRRRVYVRRRSRTTVAQARGLQRLDAYLLAGDSVANAFGRIAPVLVEVGFGNGKVLAQFAAEHADWNCIGVDVFRPGIGTLVNQCEERNITNVRIVEGEGLTFLASLGNESVDLLWVLFPDPWPKSRHHKRRLVTREFGAIAVRKLKSGGHLTLATDSQPYANAINESLENIDLLVGGLVAADATRAATKYEERGVRLGHQVTDFEYVKHARCAKNS